MAAALGIIRLGNRENGEPFQAKENVVVCGRKTIAAPGKTHIISMMVIRSSWKARL